MNTTQKNIINASVASLFTQNNSITVGTLHKYLRANHSTFMWDTGDLINHLHELGLPSLSTTKELLFFQNKDITLDVLRIAADRVKRKGWVITKTNLKSEIRLLGFGLANFNDVFTQFGFAETGKYTTDNHKIYALRDKIEHFSKTKQEITPIREMPKPYLYNTLVKQAPALESILQNPDGELYKLLYAYLTFNIPDSINNTI